MSSTSSPSPFAECVPRRGDTIPELLARRQLGSRNFTYGRGRQVTQARFFTELSSAVAWNPSRLQNMILVVGPRTPAAILDAGDCVEDQRDTGDVDMGSHSTRTEHTQSSDLERGSAPHSDHRLDHDFNRGMDGYSDQAKPVYDSSMSHKGCINTASWLSSPWRLSLMGYDTPPELGGYHECPTQIMTAGDDRVVKFWDVSWAMGSSSPFPGDPCVQPPFADLSRSEPSDWKQFVKQEVPIAGSVMHLGTIETGHLGNIFHVTPLDHHIGKVATCSADGSLRLSDLESGTSSDVWSQDSVGTYRKICLSHQFIDPNCGLLCSEGGLNRFDIRMPPWKQSYQPLFGYAGEAACKACAVWSSSGGADVVESAYVFAGGASGDVTLFDLRMANASCASKVVQRYCPRNVDSNAVCVSGLDISKDRSELLVSYENDQIYTFPIFPGVRSAAGPTSEDISECCRRAEEDPEHRLPELATIGTHLNRLTFLKSAKYAGPKDEYIVTGSDSGHAWIYVRATGVVSSLLSADSRTCNGVVPHPTLPLFVTYGIDHTAKLWRATPPVDCEADDSPLGRARRHHQQEYRATEIVNDYNPVARYVAKVCADTEFSLFPDQLPANKDRSDGSHTMGDVSFESRCVGGRGENCSIGNSVGDLPDVLVQNFIECALAHSKGGEKPIESGLRGLSRRIATVRLRHQADQRGLLWNPTVPWILQARGEYVGSSLCRVAREDEPKVAPENVYGNVVDFVPDFLSDWIPFDSRMVEKAMPCAMDIPVDYLDFYREHSMEGRLSDGIISVGRGLPWISENMSPNEKKEALSASSYSVDDALHTLYKTAELLKNGGNAAFEDGSIAEAARRYEKAIRYCLLALMDCGSRNQDFFRKSYLQWNSLKKLFVMTRLNLCMVLSKFDTKAALDQATLARRELRPFCSRKGKVMNVTRLQHAYKDDEPEQTFNEAKELEAKVLFRIGCVHMQRSNFREAKESFKGSISCTKELKKEPEPIVLRQLVRAKREDARESQSQKRIYKRMFES